MRSPVYTIDWKEIRLQHWGTKSADAWMRQSETFSFSGLPVRPEGEVLRLSFNEDLIDELRWNNSFARSFDLLEQMANEALAERDAGRTTLLDLDDL